jgi:hypothetical protein
MIAVLEELYAAGARVACAVTHSFRLIRTHDHQYRDTAIDYVNVHRVRALSRYLRRHRDRFRVTTFRELPVADWMRTLDDGSGRSAHFPSPPWWSSLTRLAVQALKDRHAV